MFLFKAAKTYIQPFFCIYVSALSYATSFSSVVMTLTHLDRSTFPAAHRTSHLSHNSAANLPLPRLVASPSTAATPRLPLPRLHYASLPHAFETPPTTTHPPAITPLRLRRVSLRHASSTTNPFVPFCQPRPPQRCHCRYSIAPPPQLRCASVYPPSATTLVLHLGHR